MAKMPPALLAHFKEKAEKKESATPEEQKETDKTKRKEALRKAQLKLKEKGKKPE